MKVVRLNQGGIMSAGRGYGKKSPAPKRLASYFGLTVVILFRMRNCSLIRWHDRNSIVDTADLLIVPER